MNAETAKELAQNQREKIIETIKRETLESINEAISKGLFEIYLPVDICPDNEYKISIRVSWQ